MTTIRQTLKLVLLLLIGGLLASASPAHAQSLRNAVTTTSPDGEVAVEVGLSEPGAPRYAVRYDGATVLRPSPLGLETSMGDWRRGLSVQDVSAETTVTDDYRLRHGKQSEVDYEAHRRTLRLTNRAGQPIEIMVQVSNHGFALRYRIPSQAAPDTVVAGDEHTGFRFTEGTRSWLIPMDPPDAGWSQTFPAYERRLRPRRRIPFR